MMKIHVRLAAVVFVLSILLATTVIPAGHAAHSHEHHAHEHGSGKNALIEEMLVLDGVFREVVSAVAVGDGKRVAVALEAMHGTMEKTHEGVQSGDVKVSKNSGRMKEFVDLDKKFHADLETLAHEAGSGNRKRMLSLTKKLLDGCVKCHDTFRK